MEWTHVWGNARSVKTGDSSHINCDHGLLQGYPGPGHPGLPWCPPPHCDLGDHRCQGCFLHHQPEGPISSDGWELQLRTLGVSMNGLQGRGFSHAAGEPTGGSRHSGINKVSCGPPGLSAGTQRSLWEPHGTCLSSTPAAHSLVCTNTPITPDYKPLE